MELLQSADNELTITGDINKEADYKRVHEQISEMVENNNTLVLNLKKCNMVSSALLGHLLKLVKKDSVKITIRYENDNIPQTFEKLRLDQYFSFEEL